MILLSMLASRWGLEGALWCWCSVGIRAGLSVVLVFYVPLTLSFFFIITIFSELPCRIL